MVEQGGGRAPHDHHSAPALERKRGPSDYAAAHHTHDETQEQTQIERLPFEGGLLSQQAHNQVCFKNNGPNHKDHLELIGRGNSAVNWIAPERQIKKPGLQLVAKIALDDDSFEAFRKTIQREARGAGGVLANIWVQIHEPPTSEEETPTVVNGQSTAADIADKESPAPVVTEEIPVQGGSRPLSIGPPDQFRFGSPSSFTGTPFAKNPYAVQFANTGMLPIQYPKYNRRVMDDDSEDEDRSQPLVLAEPQPRPCAHCQIYGREDANSHEIRDCGYGSKLGDVPGCPLCNRMTHYYDGCRKRKRSPADRRHEDWKFLVEYRSGLPPVRTKMAWPDLVTNMQPTHGFPITKDMALQVRDNHRHGTQYHDPLTRTLGDVRKNLERLRASEVFTGMGC